MRHLRAILILIWRAERAALLRGVALSIIVLVMGLALLGLSGWFITAAGLAGLLGLGATFDIFRPSAGVRFLAMGRTAARYGERLLTHDATLRALAALRIRLLQALSGQGWERLGRLRGSEMLNRLGADVDALDGAVVRLAIPAVAAGVTLSLALVVIALLTTPLLALASVGSFTLGGILALIWATMRARKPSRRAARAVQALRVRMIDLLRAKADLAVMGRLEGARDGVLTASARLDAARAAGDAVEHRASAGLGVTTTIAATIALLLGAVMARAGLISAPQAALGFFVMLAMAETLAPLRRGLTELGAMLDAAARVDLLLQAAPEPRLSHRAAQPEPEAPALELSALRYRYPGAAAPVLDGFDLRVLPGEAVALMGRSGAGKSTVLHLAAGLISPESGGVRLTGQPLAEPTALLPVWGDWRSGALAPVVAESLGLSRGTELLPDLAPVGAARAGLSQAAAEATGLPQGLPVLLGPGDVQATLVGLGLGSRAGVGRASIFGTSAIHACLLDDPAAMPQAPAGAMIQQFALGPGYLCFHPCFNGATLLHHLSRRFADLPTAPAPDYSALILHPFLEPGGERAPWTDPHASGAVIGLTAASTPAQIAWAGREALAFVTRASHAMMGAPGGALSLGGGLAGDEHFAQFLATVTGCTVQRRPGSHAGLRGLAAIAARFLLDARDPAPWIGSTGHGLAPDPGPVAAYAEGKYRLFAALLEAVSPFWEPLSDLRVQAEKLMETP